MFKKIGILFFLSLFVFSCTKKDVKKAPTVKLVKYKSVIPYTFKKIDNADAAAMVDQVEVPWSQLLSGDVALQDLQNRYDQQALAFAFAWATSLKKSDSETLKVFINKPDKDIKDVLAKANVEFVEGINIEYELSPGNPSLANFAQSSVSWDEFNNANMMHSKLYDKLFQQRMQRLNGIVIRRMLLKEAKSQGIAMEEYVRKNIISEPYQATEDEIKTFAAEKNITGKALDEKMMERLKDILIQNDRDSKIENYVAKNLIKTPIPIAYPSPVIKLNASSDMEGLPQWGKDSKANIMFIGHWDCKGCDGELKSFLNLKEKFQKNVKGLFLYSFSAMDREARMGAEAAFCIEDQDEKGFWTFLTKIMEIKEDNIEERINTAAQASGIDYDKFRNCFLARDHQDKVNQHLEFAKEMGVTSAPLFTLNGLVLESPVSETDIQQQLNEMGLVQKAEKKGIFAKIKALFGF